MFRLLHLFDRVKMKVFIVNFTISFLHPFHQQLFYVSHTQSLFGCVLFGNIPTYSNYTYSMTLLSKSYKSFFSTLNLLIINCSYKMTETFTQVKNIYKYLFYILLILIRIYKCKIILKM